jgi:hypothetical protein
MVIHVEDISTPDLSPSATTFRKSDATISVHIIPVHRHEWSHSVPTSSTIVIIHSLGARRSAGEGESLRLD